MPHGRHQYHDALSASHTSVASGGGPGAPALTGKPTFRVARPSSGLFVPPVSVAIGGARVLASARGMTGAADVSSADYKQGYDLGLADGAGAGMLATTLAMRHEPVTLAWLNDQRVHYDNKKSTNWQAGYNDGFKDTAPRLEAYLKKVSPDTPDEPFRPPPNTPTGLLASAKDSAKTSPVTIGLGVLAVGAIGYGGWRWWRSR